MSGGFDYGNARVRALKSDLLGEGDYRSLVNLDLDGMVAALTETSYRADLQAATARYRGRRRLEEALRTNLARTLRQLPDWYEGSSAAGVEMVLTRWDVRNVRTILRGSHARTSPGDIRALLVAAGSLGEDMLAELSDQPDLRTTVELMVVRGAPSPRIARDVMAAWPEFEVSDDFQTLEHALERSRAEQLSASLAVAEPVLSRALRAEVDQAGLLAALRLQQSFSDGGADRDTVDPEERFLPGGTLSTTLLARVAHTEDAAGAAALLLQAALPERWREPVARWGQTDDLGRLNDELDAALTRSAVALFSTSDPLGIGIPVAYVWAKENEVRNLRLVGAGLAAGTPGDLIEEELLIL